MDTLNGIIHPFNSLIFIGNLNSDWLNLYAGIFRKSLILFDNCDPSNSL